MTRKTIAFTDHLIQATLASALKKIVGEENWLGEEVRVPDTRYRWDMMFKANGKTFVVEFDGDSHYRDSLVIRKDREKDEIAKKMGYTVVRVPYFVQLTTETLHHWFGLDADIVQEFPHGFIKSKVYPASFCAMGVWRFEYEVYHLPFPVFTAIMDSLFDRTDELNYNLNYTFGEALSDFLDDVLGKNDEAKDTN